MADKKTKKSPKVPVVKSKTPVADDLDGLIGKPKKAKKKVKAVKLKLIKAVDALDDLIGKPKKPVKKAKADDLDDLIGAPRPKKVVEVGDVGYTPLTKPKVPHPDGLWVRRERKGKNWGVTCLECNEPLKYNGGRPPVHCGKPPCFRAYRNLYRRDYEKQRADAA